MIDEKKLIEDIEKEFDGVCTYDVSPSRAVQDFTDIVDRQPKVGVWIPVSERLPNMEEYLENDGRFILDDGNRRYQGLFDIYDKKFKFSKHLSGLSYELIEDNCVIAWQPLPEPYKAGEQE